nr:immunoglobulin light chain junction region [Macaca mulatta]MOX26238.1 immunoglobulin light chain junction region [Macaca mulatta]MOX27530.1 immunoglobulin light chain junction region [Macaca mulatta]
CYQYQSYSGFSF